MFVRIPSVSWCDPAARPRVRLQVNLVSRRNDTSNHRRSRFSVVKWFLFPLHVISQRRPSFQFCGVLVPAHGRAGSPRRHALGTLCHVPPRPYVTSLRSTRQLPVALGFRRLRAKSQPARGALFQRLHALLRESPTTRPGAPLGRVT